MEAPDVRTAATDTLRQSGGIHADHSPIHTVHEDRLPAVREHFPGPFRRESGASSDPFEIFGKRRLPAAGAPRVPQSRCPPRSPPGVAPGSSAGSTRAGASSRSIVPAAAPCPRSAPRLAVQDHRDPVRRPHSVPCARVSPPRWSSTISTSQGPSSVQRKQTRHCALIRMPCRPARSPRSASSRLLGNAARSPVISALSGRSLRTA